MTHHDQIAAAHRYLTNRAGAKKDRTAEMILACAAAVVVGMWLAAKLVTVYG